MTVPHYGKREPGALTAAAPGDTLYFNFASYNDSGDSEALTGLAVTDIEVFKNGIATTRATDSGYSLISDTGMVGDRAGLYRFSVQLFNTADDTGHYESGAWYQVAVDSVGIDGKTVRLWVGSFEIGRQRVDVRAINGDTGAAGWLSATYASGFTDTGLNQRLGQIQSDVDTGLRNQLSDVDTGLHDAIADLDTGLRDHVDNTDTGLRKYVDNLDTGIKQRFNALAEDTGGVNINAIFGDTGAANQLRAAFANGFADTGLYSRLDKLAEDTGGVNINAIQGDTGAAGWLRATFASGFTDTGLDQRLAQIQSDVDTGLRAQLSDVDTGLHDAIADLDTGLRDHVDNTDTGLRALLSVTGINVKALVGDTGAANWLKTVFLTGFTDTGLYSRLDKLSEDTGGVNINSIQGDTGAAGWLRAAFANGFADTGLYSRIDKLAEDTGGVNINAIQGDTGAAAWLKATFAQGFTDTGLNERLARIQSDVDTGLRTHIDDSDTGLKDAIADLDTGLRDYIDNTDTGLRKYIDNLDTGIKERFDSMAEDTGGVNINAIAGDTGAESRLQQFAGTKLSATGMLDTGTLAGTKAGTIDSNVVSVNETSVQGTGANGDEWRPA